MVISLQRVIRSTSCLILGWGFRERWIEQRCLRFEQIQDAGRRHVGKISNGDISATGHPIHFMFCSRVGFSGTADQMALFWIRTNSRWRPPPSWTISNGHISATAHDLLIYRASRGHFCDSTAFLLDIWFQKNTAAWNLVSTILGSSGLSLLISLHVDWTRAFNCQFSSY